jgi:hypothetical protein
VGRVQREDLAGEGFGLACVAEAERGLCLQEERLDAVAKGEVVVKG